MYNGVTGRFIGGMAITILECGKAVFFQSVSSERDWCTTVEWDEYIAPLFCFDQHCIFI